MTGDRVAEIRERVNDAANGDDAEMKANAETDLAYLLAENARLRAQLDTARELSAPYLDGCPGDDECCAESLTNDLRAALNQGGETNGE